jgi:hypothetical protein
MKPLVMQSLCSTVYSLSPISYLLTNFSYQNILCIYYTLISRFLQSPLTLMFL